MAHRPLADFHPRERLAQVPHTTRRFACRSALALSADGRSLAVVSDQGAGTYEACTLPATGGKPQRAITVGPIVGDNYPLLDGIKPGERVVTSGAQKLADGAPVQPAGESQIPNPESRGR